MNMSSTNAIKALVQRFLSLPLATRMQLTKRLLELYNSDDASSEIEASGGSRGPAPRNNFLEEFWDEVEKAHADNTQAVNPFREERHSRAREVKAAPEIGQQGGYLPLIIHHSNLLPLL
jgi:hypothetical protein